MAAIGGAEAEQIVRELLASEELVEVDIGQLDAGASLTDAGLTSLRAVQLVVGLEERLAITIPDEHLSQESFGSIGQIVDLVRKVMAAR